MSWATYHRSTASVLSLPLQFRATAGLRARWPHLGQLGDCLGDGGNYHVIHKLGHGWFANVWLCRDTREQPPVWYVALKILMADVSVEECSELRAMQLGACRDAESAKSKGAQYICLPLDKFDIDGPNGTHFCFVHSVLGPRVSLGLYHGSEDPI